jgi:two-component system, sensor histidine kinase and response regulator
MRRALSKISPNALFLAMGIGLVPLLFTFVLWHNGRLEGPFELLGEVGFSLLLGFFAYFLQVFRNQAAVLQKSELRFRLFVDGVQDYAILNLDPEGRVSSWNAGARHIKGYEESEVIGKHFSIFYTPEDIAKGHPARELEIARREGQYKEEGIRVRKDGSPIWAEVLITAILTPQRDLLGYAKLTRDISDRKRMEQAARERVAEVENANQRFELMAEGASVGIWDWKNVKEPEVYWSPRFYKLLGYREGEIPSTVDSYAQLIHPEDRQESLIAYSRVLSAGAVSNREYRLRTKSGEYRWFLSSGSLARDQDGKPYRMVGSIQDIHTRKLLEQKLREAVNARSMFLANMSHEIRTPMNGIIGMTSLLLQSELSENARDYVDTLRRSSEVLLSLLNDILDLSKIEAGKVIIEKQSFDIRGTVETAIALFSEAANDKRIYLSSVVYPSVPKLVIGDGTRFQQILSNLVSNAIKFTDAGEVSIQVAAEQSVTDHVLVTLDVTDTGIGMPPHVMANLFTPFVQGDNSTTRRFGGTGLGLSISKKLAQLMGGDIEVASELCEGSRFRVCIPFETKAVRIAPLPKWDKVETVVFSTNPFLTRNTEQLLSCKSARTIACSDLSQCRSRLSAEQAPNLLIVHWQAENASDCEQAAAIAQEYEVPVLWILPERAESRAEEKHPRIRLPLRQSTLLRKVAECANLDHLQTRLVVLEPDKNHSGTFTLSKSPLCLIAEDNSTNQKVLRRMLENLGLRCDVVSNGAEALAAVQNIHYDLILMDCLMPEMDGYQASLAIRSLPHDRFSQIPIVAVTANVSETERSRCLQAGMNEYLAKPIVFADLHQVIAKCLEQTASEAIHKAA